MVLWALATTLALQNTILAMERTQATVDVILVMVVTPIQVLDLEDTTIKHRLQAFF